VRDRVIGHQRALGDGDSLDDDRPQHQEHEESKDETDKNGDHQDQPAGRCSSARTDATQEGVTDYRIASVVVLVAVLLHACGGGSSPTTPSPVGAASAADPVVGMWAVETTVTSIERPTYATIHASTVAACLASLPATTGVPSQVGAVTRHQASVTRPTQLGVHSRVTRAGASESCALEGLFDQGLSSASRMEWFFTQDVVHLTPEPYRQCPPSRIETQCAGTPLYLYMLYDSWSLTTTAGSLSGTRTRQYHFRYGNDLLWDAFRIHERVTGSK